VKDTKCTQRPRGDNACYDSNEETKDSLQAAHFFSVCYIYNNTYTVTNHKTVSIYMSCILPHGSDYDSFCLLCFLSKSQKVKLWYSSLSLSCMHNTYDRIIEIFSMIIFALSISIKSSISPASRLIIHRSLRKPWLKICLQMQDNFCCIPSFTSHCFPAPFPCFTIICFPSHSHTEPLTSVPHHQQLQ
jgi:hypothetical protein